MTNLWHESAEAWIDFVDQGDANRELLLDPLMLEECGRLPGLHVLDVGCGEGRFCRMLAKRGAIPVGIDPTLGLIRKAQARGKAVRYARAGGERLPFRTAAFDLVVSYLSLIDIPDYQPAIAEMARVLRPGGALVAANLTSYATACYPLWEKDEEGNKLFAKLDRYPEERADVVSWREIEIENWHRPMSGYMQAFLGAGLVLQSFQEPVPSAEAIEACPYLEDMLRVPLFWIMRWTKR